MHDPTCPCKQPPTQHPGWCSPKNCYSTDSDRQHCSELVPLRLRDAQVTLAWVQADEYAFPNEQARAELRIDIVHSIEGQDSTLYLLPQEIHRLIDRLTTEYYRQVYLSAPIVHSTRAVA